MRKRWGNERGLGLSCHVTLAAAETRKEKRMLGKIKYHSGAFGAILKVWRMNSEPGPQRGMIYSTRDSALLLTKPIGAEM